VFFHRRGERRDRSVENQRSRASGLHLVTAAVGRWNTVALERAIQAIMEHGHPVDAHLLPHFLPLSWAHMTLTGDDVWWQSRKVERGKFRPLPVRLEPWRLHATERHFSGQPVTTPREIA
jgi:hypothetical protein